MYGDGMQVRDWLHVSDHAAGIEFVLRHGAAGRGVQPRRRERATEPRGHRAAAGGDGPRLVARPLGARPAGARSPVRDGRLEGGRARLAGAGAVRGGPARRRSPGIASIAEWVAAARSGDWDAYYARQYGDRLAAGRGGGRGRLTDAGRGHRRPGPPGPGADRGARERAVHRHARARSPWSRPELDLDTLTTDSVIAPDRARPPGGRHPRRRLDRRRRLRQRPGPRAAPQRRSRPAWIAEACADRGVHLALVSTNEVFDGARTDGLGYAPDDEPAPINAYGREQARGRAPGDRRDGARRRHAVRDRSARRGSTGRRATTSRPRSPQPRCGAKAAGEPLRVVGDEIGTPTYTPDVADADRRAASGRTP